MFPVIVQAYGLLTEIAVQIEAGDMVPEDVWGCAFLSSRRRRQCITEHRYCNGQITRRRHFLFLYRTRVAMDMIAA